MPAERLIIITCGDAWVAVDKPAGLATIPGRAEEDSVLERLARQLNLPFTGSADPRVRVVHQLDKDTSGVLLFALDSPTQRHLSQQFQQNTAAKEYLALVVGHPADNEGEVDAPLGRHPTSPLRMAILKKGGRPARTAWVVEQAFRQYALLRVFPKTGKTHQIRVHLKAAGMPLAIDPLYNPSPRGTEPGLMLSSFKRGYHTKRSGSERPLISRLTLHAHRLTFHVPEGQTVTVEAPLPKDFRSTLNMLQKYAGR